MNQLPKINRQCGSCTACCEGWLQHPSVYGHPLEIGTSCHFLGCGGCAIYENRPIDPCVNYRCAWLEDDGSNIPEWLYPKLSDVIINRRSWGNNGEKTYLVVIECGKKIDSVVLNWLINYSISKNVPIHYQVNGSWNAHGPKEFHAELRKQQADIPRK
jgi:hypothetical protein